MTKTKGSLLILLTCIVFGNDIWRTGACAVFVGSLEISVSRILKPP